jgi:hypothetical protein
MIDVWFESMGGKKDHEQRRFFVLNDKDGVHIKKERNEAKRNGQMLKKKSDDED